MSIGLQTPPRSLSFFLAAACLLVLTAAPARADTVKDCDFGAPVVPIRACIALIQKDPKDTIASAKALDRGSIAPARVEA